MSLPRLILCFIQSSGKNPILPYVVLGHDVPTERNKPPQVSENIDVIEHHVAKPRVRVVISCLPDYLSVLVYYVALHIVTADKIPSCTAESSSGLPRRYMASRNSHTLLRYLPTRTG